MESNSGKTVINNDFYDTLGDKWYTAYDHPVALLRAENDSRVEWIVKEMEKWIEGHAKILDIGCGAGLLSNALAERGYDVTGIDISKPSLEIAKRYNTAQNKVLYLCGNAYELPFVEGTFNVVCATDLLEHVENPRRVVEEASRVLSQDGLFFFHTFNRNFLSKLIVIKGVDWFVRNAPKNMHVFDLFIKPEELKSMLQEYNLETVGMKGLVPKVFSAAFIKLIFTRKVPKDFKFVFNNSLLTGYCGFAVKK